jgi:hypothetical protein
LRNDSEEKTFSDAMRYDFLGIRAAVLRTVRSYASMRCTEIVEKTDVPYLGVSDKTKELGLSQIYLSEITERFIKNIDELGISHRQIYIPDLRI